MKVIKLTEEAEKLNVPLEFVNQAFSKALREGKIYGLEAPEEAEIIQFKPDEIEVLVVKLESARVTPKTLETDLNLTAKQVLLVLNYLLREKKVKGVLTHDGEFLSDQILKGQVLKAIEKKRKADTHDIANQLSVSEHEVGKVIEKVSSQILVALAPYAQIKIEDLSVEVGISKEALLPLLKRIILDGRVSARLDMVNETLVIDKHKNGLEQPLISNKYRDSEDKPLLSRNETKTPVSYSPSFNKPSNAWYLAPLLFGLIGGLIGYIAVKDDDGDMAGNLLILGIIITIVGGLLAWAYSSWIFSQIL